MLRCEDCGKITEKGQPVNKVVKSYRQVTYNNIVKTRKQEKRYGVPKGEVWQTHGREIETEQNVCPECCIALTGQKPKMKQQMNKPKPEEQQPRRRKPGRYERVERKENRRRPKVKVVNRIPFVK